MFTVPSGESERENQILRKEVIQPQVPLRLPCYDLVPIRSFAFGACLVRRLRASVANDMKHDVAPLHDSYTYFSHFSLTHTGQLGAPFWRFPSSVRDKP